MCGEETHHLHSWRLAHKSKFLKTALDIPMKEKQEKKIEVKEVDPVIISLCDQLHLPWNAGV